MRTQTSIFFLFFLGLFFSGCSPLGKHVDKEKSSSHFYNKKKTDVLYCPAGNWFEIGATPLNVDLQSFQLLNSSYGKDDQQAYFQREAIPAGSIDLASFDVPASDCVSHIAIDKEHVYKMAYKAKITIVEDAQPNSFECIDSYISRDADHIYYRFEKTEIDADSFQKLHTYFSKDANQAYYYTYDSFESFDADINSLKALDGAYIFDKNQIYFYAGVRLKSDIIKLVSIPYTSQATLEVLDHNFLKADKSVYSRGQLIEAADSETFEAIKHPYSKDAQHVFYFTSIVEGADPTTFTYNKDERLYQDAHSFYKKGQVIENK